VFVDFNCAAFLGFTNFRTPVDIQEKRVERVINIGVGRDQMAGLSTGANNPRTKQLMRLFYPRHTAQETSEPASIILHPQEYGMLTKIKEKKKIKDKEEKKEKL
jgi:hypothetical protein